MNGSYGKTKLYFPITQTLPLAVKFQEPVPSGVSTLFGRRCPPAIHRTITAVVIDPI
jgi:hypothetical protein